MKKIKIFLGAYINKQNAQNNNCNALATHLDRDKYDIYTMKRDDGNIDIDYIEKFATVFNYNHKIKILKSWNYIKALYFCDILYLPRLDGLSLVLIVNKIFKKKIFITIEALYNEDVLNTLNIHKKMNNVKKIDNLYSITKYVKEYNKKNIDINTKKTILYLGIDNNKFIQKKVLSNYLKDIIFIGNNMQHKRVDEFLKLAKSHTDLYFHIVGTATSIDIQYIEKNYKNVVIYGAQNPKELNIILQNIDLHILPSRSEGFPKVTLETAAVGIPSIVYGTYGADEWIENKKNGFIINSYDEMDKLLSRLKDDQELLLSVSKEAPKLAKKYSWVEVIREWEKEIARIYNDR